MEFDNAYRDKFLSGYIECALWSSLDNPLIEGEVERENDGENLDANFGREDIAEDTLKQMTEDCNAFIDANQQSLTRYHEGLPERPADHAGHDFWLTRNRHGAGFWDRYYGSDGRLRAACDGLSIASRAYGEYNLDAYGGKVEGN